MTLAMTTDWRLFGLAVLLGTAVLPGPGGQAVGQGIAPVASPQSAGKAAKPGKGARQGAGEAAKKVDPAAAQRLVEAGIKSFDAGKFEPAVQSLSAALRGGGLPAPQMAKALYYRGIAYRKQGKPAQAISDLTSALWLKGGLNETERAQAMENRAAAYREAGIGDQPAPSLAQQEQAPAGLTAAAAPSAPPTSPPAARPRRTAAAPTEPATGPVAAGGAGSWSTATAAPGSSAPTPVLAAAPVESAAPAPTAPAAGTGSAITGFFSNLFGGGSGSASKPAEAPQTTASTGTAATATTAVSSWSEATTVTGARTRHAAAAPAPATAAKAPVSATASAGKYRLQVGAVRSRGEADAMAARLKQQHAALVGTREAVIDEQVFGNMGTFYRVRLGPYADANEPRQHCATLRASGFDCMLVTQ